MFTGATQKFKATPTPDGSTLPAEVVWSVSDTALATIDANGDTVTVTAVSAGTVTLTATSDNLTGTADIDITVEVIPATGINVAPVDDDAASAPSNPSLV